MSVDIRAIAKENIENRVARVFVSSTFRDMEDERKLLADTVFRRFRAKCKERNVEFVPIDLRWGITEKQSESGETLEICLREIDRSRPFFICFLGSAYGTLIETTDVFSDSFLKDYPEIKDYQNADLSYTAAEIRHGVLDVRSEDKDCVTAHFWVKDSMEHFDSRQSEQIAELEKNGYSIDKFISPEDLGKQVEEELNKWLNHYFPKPNNLSWLEKQSLEQNAFELSRSRLYVSSPSNYDALDAFVAAGDSRVLAVTGASGLGKSSLLINWAKHCRERNPKALILTHYISASEGSDQPKNILRRLTETLDLTTRARNGVSVLLSRFGLSTLLNRFGQSKSLDGWKKEFTIAVNKRLAKGPETSLVLVIDGLNQLSEYDDAKNLVWLPELAKAKVIVSTVDTDEKTIDAIKRRDWKTHKAQPLTEEQKNKVIEQTLKDRGRSLSPERIQKIVESPITSNPLALCVLLDELCCFTDFKIPNSEETQFDLALARYVASASIDDLLEKIFERVEESLAWLNKTTNKDNVVPSLASLIAVSRYGLTNGELLRISGCSQLVVSTFLCVFDAHLVNHSGRYAYSHGYIRTAIEDRYAPRFTRTRELLADSFLEEDEFKRRCKEVPWQLKELGQWERLYDFLLDFDVFDELYDGKLTSDFCLYWNELLRLKNGGFKFDGYLELDDSRYDDKKKAFLWHNLGHVTSAYNVYEISKEAYNKSLLIFRGLATKNSEAYDPDVAMTLNNLGNLHRDMGSYSESESEYAESLTIYRGLAAKNPEVYSSEVATTLNNLGLLHRDMGLYSKSESELEESLTILRTLAKNAPDVYNSDVATTLNNLGAFHGETGSYSKSESELEESLTILRTLAKNAPEVYNPDVATMLFNLAGPYLETERYDLAKEKLLEYVELYKKLPEAIRYSKVNQFVFAQSILEMISILAMIRKNEEEQ